MRPLKFDVVRMYLIIIAADIIYGLYGRVQLLYTHIRNDRGRGGWVGKLHNW